MNEFEQAKLWRENQPLTQAELGEAIGYARETIYWFERGVTPQGRTSRKPGKIKPWVWKRYKMACAGYEAQKRSKKEFAW